jgi:hypothetical protein
MDIYTLAENKELIFAEGPNNPASTKVSYLLERTYEPSPVFVNVIEAHRNDPIIDSVDISVKDDRVFVVVTEVSGRKRRLEVNI